jgi:hypothetical protein
MLHLYRHAENKTLFWQMSEKNKAVTVIQSGELGKVGSYEEIATNLIAKILKKKEKEGYEEPHESEWQALILDYGRVYEEDLRGLDAKMERLKNDVGKVFRDRGLGSDIYVSGLLGEELEVMCAVFDCHMAKEIIESFIGSSHIGRYEGLHLSESFK